MDKFLLTLDMLFLWATVVTFFLRLFGKVATKVPVTCLIIFVGLTIFVMVREFKMATVYKDYDDELDVTSSDDPPWKDA